MRRTAAALAVFLLAAALAGCAARTDGATQVTDGSATLHASARCDGGQRCRWYFEYWPADGSRSFSNRTPERGPVNGPTGDQQLAEVVATSANVAYRWVFCASPDDGAHYACAGPAGNFSSPDDPAPSDVATFTTPPVRSLAERWNGSRWRRQPTHDPAGATFASLAGVSCAALRSCVAVGAYGTTTNPLPLAERWTGAGGWQPQAVPQPPGTQNSRLNGVSCPSTASCLAIGASINPSVPLAERWDGTRWTILAAPSPGGAQSSALQSVSCVSLTACEAVGSAFLGSGFQGPTTRTFAERWDGRAWTLQTVPGAVGVNGELRAVSCPTATECVAVGDAGPPGNHVVQALRWDGMSWAAQAISTPIGPRGPQDSNLNGVSCPSSTSCWAVGSAGGSPLLERLAGGTWSVQSAPTLNGLPSSFLQGISCASDTACTAVGYSLRSVAGAFEPVSLAARWDGATWTVTPGPALHGQPRLNGVSCPSETACAAVGMR